MDSTYNDPNFVPVYSLDGMDDAIVAVWKILKLGILKSYLEYVSWQ